MVYHWTLRIKKKRKAHSLYYCGLSLDTEEKKKKRKAHSLYYCGLSLDTEDKEEKKSPLIILLWSITGH